MQKYRPGFVSRCTSSSNSGAYKELKVVHIKKLKVVTDVIFFVRTMTFKINFLMSLHYTNVTTTHPTSQVKKSMDQDDTDDKKIKYRLDPK